MRSRQLYIHFPWSHFSLSQLNNSNCEVSHWLLINPTCIYFVPKLRKKDTQQNPPTVILHVEINTQVQL